MNWNLWIKQALTVTKMELKRYVLGRRWIGVYLFAYAPVFILFLALIRRDTHPGLQDLTEIYAVFYQTFFLRLALFFSSAMVFSQLYRGEVLEKTLHFYLLAPIRREVLMAGKYLAGVIAMGVIFGSSAILTNLFLYMHHPAWATVYLEGSGFSMLARYIVVTIMACAAYGGVFMLTGTLFKNPAGPAILIGAWEAFFFILPASIQKFTIMHYLQSMLPVAIDRGPFAVLVDPTHPILGIPVLMIVAGFFVWTTGQIVRRAQVTYSAD